MGPSNLNCYNWLKFHFLPAGPIVSRVTLSNGLFVCLIAAVVPQKVICGYNPQNFYSGFARSITPTLKIMAPPLIVSELKSSRYRYGHITTMRTTIMIDNDDDTAQTHTVYRYQYMLVRQQCRAPCGSGASK